MAAQDRLVVHVTGRFGEGGARRGQRLDCALGKTVIAVGRVVHADADTVLKLRAGDVKEIRTITVVAIVGERRL
jgi:hypothetical protein